MISASTSSFGGRWAQDDVRKALRLSGAAVIGEGLAVGKAAERLVETGVADEEIADGIDDVLERLVGQGRRDEARARDQRLLDRRKRGARHAGRPFTASAVTTGACPVTLSGWWQAARCPRTCGTSGGSSVLQISVA